MVPAPRSYSQQTLSLSPQGSFDYEVSHSQYSPKSAMDYPNSTLHRSSTDRHGQQFAHVKALELLESTVAAQTPTSGSLASRQAAIQRREQRKIDDQPVGIRKKVVVPMALEKKATTTRKIELTASDVRDPETVAGMMYKIEIDRQKEAEKKALKLVNSEMYTRLANAKGGVDVIV